MGEDLGASDFEKMNYEKKQIIADELVEKGVPVYKINTSELWDLVIPIDSERGAELEKEGYVKVRFLKNQYESWASTKMIYGKNGETLLNLHFNNSMVTFVSDRFLDVELILEEEKGLKIPLTSIVDKEFFLLGEPYLIDEGQKGKRTVIRQCYLEDGTISTERITVGIYSYDEENDTLTSLSSYNIPNKVQGIAFDKGGQVYLSTSYGRNSSSYLKVYASLLTLTKHPNEPSAKVEMPPCSEEIAIADDNVYVLFESASLRYFEGTDGKGNSSSPIDKVLEVTVASIW